ncbi:hypothetical protein ATCC90586_010213 [Pythium insidiosum]|nr:hypothetical protein ATCC90586_010213 [Pythium insidiosum]
MVGKGKPAKKPERHENNHAALGGTLEDYFNSQKAYQSGQLKEMSKAMTKHLLTGSGSSNAMIMEKEDAGESEAAAAEEKARQSTVAESKGAKDDSEGEGEGEAKAGGGHDDSDDDDEHDGDKGAPYEDDYESDASGDGDGVAGLTLSDYLHAQSDGVIEHRSKEAPVAYKSKVGKSHHATSGKAPPPALVSGMSLDYYLGASSSAMTQDEAPGKPAPSGRPSPTRRPKPKAKKAPLSTTLPTAQEAAEDTPFQRRVKKKHKQRRQQELHQSQLLGGATAKSILLGESASTGALQVVSRTLAPAKDREGRHAKATTAESLPKLSAHSHHHHPHHHAHHSRHDAEDDGTDQGAVAGNGTAATADAADEKLPPLATTAASAGAK